MQFAQHAHEAALARRLQPGQHFVEQQQLRIGGQGLGHFQRLQLRQRQAGGGIAAGLGGQAGEVEDLGYAPRVHPAGAEALSDQQVFVHRQFVHRLRDLEGAAYAQARAAEQGRAQDVLAVETDRAAGRACQPGYGVEQRGLASAVGADQSQHLVAVHPQRDAVHGRQAAEAHGQPVQFKHGMLPCAGAAAAAGRTGWRRSWPPAAHPVPAGARSASGP